MATDAVQLGENAHFYFTVLRSRWRCVHNSGLAIVLHGIVASVHVNSAIVSSCTDYCTRPRCDHGYDQLCILAEPLVTTNVTER